MSRHRGQKVRPRYGRLTAAGSSLAVTGIAVLGGVGVLPSAAGDNGVDRDAIATQASSVIASTRPVVGQGDAPAPTASAPPAPTQDVETSETPDAASVADTALPAGSGSGKRVVFSQSRQRVWLVAGSRVQRTYLVSGSAYDNLGPGTYSVYSRSERAWGIDDSGTMRYFVRFTQGDNAAIGFHDIPVDDGERVQTVAQLGTPLSHGCIRQKRADAIALWHFARLGTTVVVTP